MKNSIVRGMLVGSSLGVIAVLFGLMDDMSMAHGFFAGMLAGGLAGWTIGRKKRKDANKQGSSASSVNE